MDDVDRLQAIFGENLDWLFWPAMRPQPDSAWLGHIPFAHWLVGALRPKQIVELGTYSGTSYAAFCNAAVRHGLQTKCFAVDSWVGDPHSGSYGDGIYDALAAFNALQFGGFSTLLRMSFDEAVDRFADGSIDLLHIDGFHTYEAVRHDFETWQPKLSDRAVVLLHDTAERKADFGVWRYWQELREAHDGFEFTHSHGLGVLRVGEQVTEPVSYLFNIEDDGDAAKIRDRFAELGESVRARVPLPRAEPPSRRARLLALARRLIARRV